jgi:D-lactate dehydrogenase (cytochrome)
MAALGHIGDGNVHFGSAINVEDPKEREAATKFSRQAAEAIIKKYGGTLTAEHGLGQAKSHLVMLEHGETIELMRGIKRVFDPNNIMNPMVMGLTEIPEDEYVYMPGAK